MHDAKIKILASDWSDASIPCTVTDLFDFKLHITIFFPFQPMRDIYTLYYLYILQQAMV